MGRRARTAVASGAALVLGASLATVAMADTSSTPQDLRALCAQATTHPSPSTAQWAQDCLSVLDFTPSSSPSPESPSPSTQSPWPSPTVASPVPTPASGFPTAATTGVPAGTVLTTDSRCTVSDSNTVISNRRFTCRVKFTGVNTVFRNSVFDFGIDNWSSTGGHRYTVEDSTIGPAAGCLAARSTGMGGADFAMGGTNFTAHGVHVRGIADAFRVSGQTSTESARIVIEDSYYLGCHLTGAHSDGVQADGNSSPWTLRHTTLDIRPARSDWTAAVFNGSSGSNGPATITDNLLAGGGWVMQLPAGAAVVTGNRVVDGSWDYGPGGAACSAVKTWSDNSVVKIDSAYRVTGTVRTVGCS